MNYYMLAVFSMGRNAERYGGGVVGGWYRHRSSPKKRRRLLNGHGRWLLLSYYSPYIPSACRYGVLVC